MKYVAIIVAALCLTACGKVGTLPSAQAPVAALEAQARKGVEAKVAKWIKANAGGDYWHMKPGKLFPDVNDGEAGLDARVHGGKNGQQLLAFANAWFKGGKKFQPVTLAAGEVLVSVTTSNDEPVMFVAVFNPGAGKGRLIGAMEVVDLGYTMSQADFTRLFPDLGDVKDADYGAVLDRLVGNTTSIAL